MIRVERHPGEKGPFAEIVIDRPDKRNALSVAMLTDMAREVGVLSGEVGFNALVVRGEGRVFCAGFDMPACVDDPAALAEMLKGLSAVIRALRAFPAPVVVAAHGAAVAGGCALVAAADLVVTDRAAKLGYPVVKLGISPAVNAPALRLALPDRHARSLLLDPELIPGDRAKEIGLAHVLVDLVDDVVPRAQVEAMKLARKPAQAVRRTKAWLNEIDGSLDAGAFDRALAASMALVGSDEQVERLRAAFGR